VEIKADMETKLKVSPRSHDGAGEGKRRKEETKAMEERVVAAVKADQAKERAARVRSTLKNSVDRGSA